MHLSLSLSLSLSFSFHIVREPARNYNTCAYAGVAITMNPLYLLIYSREFRCVLRKLSAATCYSGHHPRRLIARIVAPGAKVYLYTRGPTRIGLVTFFL